MGTDEFIEGWLREKMTGTVRDMRALKYFSDAQLACAAQLREPEDDVPAADATTGAGHGTAETIRRRHHQRGLSHCGGATVT